MERREVLRKLAGGGTVAAAVVVAPAVAADAAPAVRDAVTVRLVNPAGEVIAERSGIVTMNRRRTRVRLRLDGRWPRNVEPGSRLVSDWEYFQPVEAHG